jgi:hypothetical protein
MIKFLIRVISLPHENYCLLLNRLVDVTFIYSRLLQAGIGAFSTVFPDYQERISRHEAAHFLGV